MGKACVTICKMKGLENLLLISCRSPFLDDSKIYPPLGLLYLKAAVNKELPNVNVEITDDYDLKDPAMFDRFDAVGVSIMTPQRKEANDLLWAIKGRSPNKTVIAGGPHAFHYFTDVEKEAWDYIVPKDGQRSLVKILKGEANRVELDNMDKDTWSSQPRPDRTSDAAVDLLSSYSYELDGKTASTMLTATGCPEQCTFCEDAMTKVRWSSQESLEAEMDDIKGLGSKGVYLFDDLFAMSRHKVRPIAEALKERDLVYRCNAQARYFTQNGDEMAKLLSDTGCVEIAFGAESGSQTILNNIQKRTTVEANYKTVEYAKKHGIKVKAFMLLGLPGETRETLADTEAFIKNSGIDDFQCAVYYPYKGTQIRDAIDRGDVKNDLYVVGEGIGAYGQKGGKTEAVVRTSALSSKDLLAFRDHLVSKYKPGSHEKFFDTHLATGG